jgi:hypothetical protein
MRVSAHQNHSGRGGFPGVRVDGVRVARQEDLVLRQRFAEAGVVAGAIRAVFAWRMGRGPFVRGLRVSGASFY